jgi:hypothetical protein
MCTQSGKTHGISHNSTTGSGQGDFEDFPTVCFKNSKIKEHKTIAKLYDIYALPTIIFCVEYKSI